MKTIKETEIERAARRLMEMLDRINPQFPLGAGFAKEIEHRKNELREALKNAP